VILNAASFWGSAPCVGPPLPGRRAAPAAELRDTGIRVDAVACEGDPPRVMLDHARFIDADVIAMGTQGLSGLNRLLLGSTAERVVALARCPVLTVRRESV
jgi:nucleotide-binding universal stress UspA family protein